MDVEGGVGKRFRCQFCGRVVTVWNMARHLCKSCRVPRHSHLGGGGGPTAVSGKRPKEGRKWGWGVRLLGLMAVLLVVMWNVRRLSARETNRRRLRSVDEWVRQDRWEMVLLTELKADEEGVVWMGEDEEIHDS